MSHTIVPLRPEDPDALMAWLAQQVAESAADIRPQLYALIDVTRIASPVRKTLPSSVLMSVERKGINLYADLEGTLLADSGPRLCQVDPEILLDWAVTACRTQCVGFMAGHVALPDIAAHLQSLREVSLPDGSQALFRFQDCHVTAHLWPSLSPGFGNQVLGPLMWWATPDVCGPWHVLHLAAGYKRLGPLKFDRILYDQLNEQLLVYTVADQVREVDSALLEGLTACQIRQTLQARLKKARQLGLRLQSDQALYVVLSLQLPEGFESKSPFANALERNRKGLQTFGAALDQASSDDWRNWDVDAVDE